MFHNFGCTRASGVQLLNYSTAVEDLNFPHIQDRPPHGPHWFQAHPHHLGPFQAPWRHNRPRLHLPFVHHTFYGSIALRSLAPLLLPFLPSRACPPVLTSPSSHSTLTRPSIPSGTWRLPTSSLSVTSQTTSTDYLTSFWATSFSLSSINLHNKHTSLPNGKRLWSIQSPSFLIQRLQWILDQSQLLRSYLKSWKNYRPELCLTSSQSTINL